MFTEYNKEKAEYASTFGSSFGESKPWETTMENGSPKWKPTGSDDPNAPPGLYMEKPPPEEKLDATGRSEWYNVRKGGTKEYRIKKDSVLTERGVSIVRALPEDKARYEASMARLHGIAEPEPEKRITGNFTAFDPPRYGLSKVLNDLGNDATTTYKVKDILDPITGDWVSPKK